MDTKALRQKILDLAIRGKLVPQDPNDEPASVLLERIRAEKQQMVKDGKLKPKDIKNDTIIFKGEDNLHYEKFPDGSVKCIENEIPFELPQGWECERLSNMASFSSGKTPSTSKDEYWGDDYLWITSKDMKSKYIDSSQISLSEKGAKIMQIKAPDTLLLVARSGILRHTLPVAILKKRATINQDIKAISLYDTSLAEFIYSFLKGTENHILLKYIKSGTTVENINFDEFKNIIIPVPPKSEQILINEKINTLLSFIETIESDKTDLQATIQLTKSKILDLAIRGKLVPQNPDDEPASVLLDRIRAEKEELIKQGKIKRDKKESVIFRGEDNSYYLRTGNLTETLDDWRINDIPYSWGVCCLGEVCDYGNCTNVDTKDIPETAWILDLEDIEKDTGKILQKLTLKERNSASTKHLFHKGQILYSKLRPYLNKVVLADNDGFCTSEILPLNFNSYILPEYAKCYMTSPTFLRYANHCSYGVKMPRLGTLDGKKAVLTMPPINEQKRIADKVSQLFSLLDSIAENVN